ncbi:inovirus Gp2 family protein [Aeromonas salmonicida]|uniref:inovirus Gp2 family protein n=1 Tax=Aeromonas salmonicida TaxID=645 RepID=UPI003CFC1652
MEYPSYNNLLKLEFNNLLAEAQRCYGGISSRHLKKSLDVVQSAIATFGRVFALRVDLRCANDAIDEQCDMPLCFQRNDPKVITRFIAALNSRIKADLQRKGKSGKPDYPLYIWVRERDTSKYAHYHLVLFFNKDIYGYLGCYQGSDGENMGTRVQKAWCSALGLAYPDHKHLVHFAPNGSYVFNKHSMDLKPEHFNNFLIRLAYLCKTRTKIMNDGLRNFGSSQV